MRKLVLVKATYDLGKDPETGMTVIGEQTHLVALNVNKLDHFTANEEMEMAVTKAKLYYEEHMPHAKIISIVPSVTISSDNVPQKKRTETNIPERVVDILKASWDKITPMPTPAAFDIIELLRQNGLEIKAIGDIPTESAITLEYPVFNFHPMSEIPEMNPRETDTSYQVMVDPDGYRKEFYMALYHSDLKEWTLKKEDTDDTEIDFEHARWTYPPLAARDKK